MINTKYDKLPFLPETRLEQVTEGITLSHPLSRRGHGPGFIVVVPSTGTAGPGVLAIKGGTPSPLMKWAEEGFVTVEITEAALSASSDAVVKACAAIAACESTQAADPAVSRDGVGLVAYTAELWNKVVSQLPASPVVIGAAVYADVSVASSLAPSPIPLVQHLAGKAEVVPPRTPNLTAYDYDTVSSASFALPFQADFNYAAEGVSHSRNLTFFKKLLGGPYFDLEALWDEHTYYEFENRSLECTMGTMVQEPYVNHVPTLTGGIGREELTAFYRDHFIFKNPDDIETVLLSRSMGIDRVIDEQLFKCTHNSQIDWLAPGIPPTGKKLCIPMTAVVNIRGDRLYHEHIWWDQGTVLAQLGLMPEYLPFPSPAGAGGKSLEYRVPVGGEETARKLEIKESVKSNEMFAFVMRVVEE
ncbi:uncharacterized protein B0I36DRAFT_245320 [Microdochium trichocladiopsis]|uniref:Carboxymethylenebutenolidase n=1 Tax=Microdochium trichocladiopsis TaxID=1682393 RepID=A0A9P8Y6D3_9PEZI|nr:uncharacterized protein B0I36DRAFT_245320 [Microdochium trichocladiopsis]KAH7028912.1 hypothetical protein B0I36DRAFT_245320 [Microdochium trichocladiopsis]